MAKIIYRPEVEQDLWQKLQERLPERIFDGHYHIYPGHVKSYAVTGERDADLIYWQEALGKLVGRQRLAGALVMPSIVRPGLVDELNSFVRQVAASQPGFCVAHLVRPQDDPAATEKTVLENPLVTSFKPYFNYSPAGWSSTLDQFFPEWIARLADRHRMSVTLHLGRERKGLAGPENQHLIQHYCEKYPDMRLVLAHNGMGHNIENLRQGLPALQGYPNIWFDSSGISEAASHSYVLEYFGPKRLVFGSDLPLGNTLGKIQSTGNGFLVMFENRDDWSRHFESEQYITSLYEFNTECLVSLLTAADQWGLEKSDLADIFYHNAAWLYRLEEDQGPAPDKDLFERTRFEKSRILVDGLHSCLFDQANTPFKDLVSQAAQDCPLGFRYPLPMAAARQAASSGLPGQAGPASLAYSQELSLRHSWAAGAAVTGSGQAALDLAQAAIKDLTGRETIIDCRARKITAEDLPAALAAGPAALLLPTEVLYSEDQKAWLQAVAAARQENILVIHDERGLGLRRPPGVLPQAVPSPDAAIYGSSLANGYEIGAFVAGPELWNVVGKLAWSGPAKPALAAANAMLRLDPAIFKKLELAGEKLLLAWQEAAAITGLEIRITGSPIFPAFEFTGEDKAQLHLAFVAHMKGQGVLADSFAYLQLSDYYDHSLVRKINLAFASLATT